MRTLGWLVGLSLVLFPLAARSQGWKQIQSNLDFLEGTFPDQDTPVSFTMIRVKASVAKVEIIDTFSLIGAHNPYAEFSLSEIQEKTKSLVAINAGSTKSFKQPDPAGLLIINRRLVSKAAHQVNNGIFCITKAKMLILSGSNPDYSDCIYAVQRGPFLPPDFHQITDSLKGVAHRTVIALDDKNNLYILVTKDHSTLGAIAAFLYSRTDFEIVSALNLDGSSSSGLIVESSPYTPGGHGTSFSVGNVNGLVASGIIVR